MNEDKVFRSLRFLGPELATDVLEASTPAGVSAGTELIRVGQYIKVIPIVTEGLVKVFTRHEGKDLLLYYIEPWESCTMSFAASLKNEPSLIFAVAEEDSQLLLLPAVEAVQWATNYPLMNRFFFEQFNKRYLELLDTINHLLIGKLDDRLWDYLRAQARIKGTTTLQITHKKIASELGTAREVVTRLMRKLEQEGKVSQIVGAIVINRK